MLLLKQREEILGKRMTCHSLSTSSNAMERNEDGKHSSSDKRMRLIEFIEKGFHDSLVNIGIKFNERTETSTL